MNFEFDMSKILFLIYRFFNIFIIHRIGVLGQPIDNLTLIVGGDTPAVNTSASQLPHIDTK